MAGRPREAILTARRQRKERVRGPLVATYQGRRYDQYKVEVTVDGTLLDRRLDLRSYAFEFDTGSFSWTGTAQLALALLADHFHRSEGATKRTADELALRLYREFRKKVIEVLEGDQFTLTSDQVAPQSQRSSHEVQTNPHPARQSTE